MAEGELEGELGTTRDTASESISIARPPSSHTPSVEEPSGREETVSDREERTTGIPTTASVTADATDASRHADTSTTSSHPVSTPPVHSRTPTEEAQTPSYTVQFTPSTAECYDCSQNESSMAPVGLSLAYNSPTPQREAGGRDELHHDSGSSHHTQHHTASHSTTSTAAHVLDSSGQSSPVTTPIATPIATHTAASSCSPHSLSNELGVSPYVMVKGGMVEATQYESPGLLYARSAKERHNLDILRPADEVAEDVLEMIDGDSRHEMSWEEDEEKDRGEKERGVEGEERERDMEALARKKLRSLEKRGHLKDDQSHLDASLSSLETAGDVLPPLDPSILRDLERQAHKVASSLDYIMDNLHNSLHAMTVCAKQSVLLHREAVDNLHRIVDTNVKATYSFLAKFEELKRHTAPLNDLAQQINDINKILNILERNFKTT